MVTLLISSSVFGGHFNDFSNWKTLQGQYFKNTAYITHAFDCNCNDQ